MLFFKRKKYINNVGFTLIELAVTIAIIGIMSVIYLINYRTTRERVVLDQAASAIVSDLRYAQNMAMNVKIFGSEIPSGGYGVNVGNSTTSYFIFADLDGDKIYDSPGEKFLERDLPSNIAFVPVTTTADDIDFLPPQPTVWIDGAQTAISADIVIRYGASGGPSRKITINRLTGQISVTSL